MPGRIVLSGARGGILAVALLFVAAPRATGQSFNTELLSHANSRRCPSCQRSTYSDIWGYTAPDSTELAILGLFDGVAFVNVTNPRQPVEVYFAPGLPSRWREINTYKHYAYIVNEEGGGMDIVDMSNPRHPTSVANYDSTFDTAHTIGIHDGYAYINGSKKFGQPTGMRILDLADPLHPREVGFWATRYVHDMYERDGIAYLCNIQAGGITILDVHDKAHPYEISYTGYPGNATHNCALTKNGQYLLTTDETQGGHLRIWDISLLAWPQLMMEWTANPAAIIHNVYVKGDSAYISYYTEGLQVLDISDPLSPQLVASYDTWPGVSGGFNGNWGVYPFAKSGNIYLSDITGGLFVVGLRKDGGPVLDFALRAPEGQVAPPGGGPLYFFFDLFNSAAESRAFDLSATTKTNWQVTLSDSAVSVRPSEDYPVLAVVQVPRTAMEPTRVDLEFCARSRTKGITQCVTTRIAVPTTLQDFDAEYRESHGVQLTWRLRLDPEDARRGRGSTPLVVLRAPAEGVPPDAVPGGEFVERARLALEAAGWEDAQVERGQTYVYRLALAGASTLRVLGERPVQVASVQRSRLIGNWPNPFQPETHIRFELARPGTARIAVFDLRGRMVRELSVPARQAGAHECVWDGRDGSGTPLPSGVYFYEVRSGSFRARGRMTLLQ